MVTSLGFVSTSWNNVLEKLQEFIDGRIDLELASMHSVIILDTPSHDGQQCYQVSSISIKAFKSYGPDTICTDRRTDGRTDGRTDFGFLCRTYLKGYLNHCQMEEVNKGNNKITELRTILQRESPNS
jgi:hypothetical protein